METSLDGIVLHRDMNLLYVNRAALEMFDYQESKEMLARSLLDFLEPKYRQAVIRCASWSINGEQPCSGRSSTATSCASR